MESNNPYLVSFIINEKVSFLFVTKRNKQKTHFHDQIAEPLLMNFGTYSCT